MKTVKLKLEVCLTAKFLATEFGELFSELNNSYRHTDVHIGCPIYVYTIKYIEHSLPYRRLKVSSNSRRQQL